MVEYGFTGKSKREVGSVLSVRRAEGVPAAGEFRELVPPFIR
jgi:hypothetical protein